MKRRSGSLLLPALALLALAGPAGAQTPSGFVTTGVTTNTDEFFDVAVQDDGKIVAVGSAEPTSNDEDFLIARYNPTGGLDATFDGPAGNANGAFTLSIPASTGDDRATALVIEPDGQIVVAGHSTQGANGLDFALARLNSNGTLDNTGFDGDGFLNIAFGSGGDAASGLARQADGKLVVTGSTDSFSPRRFAIARTLDSGGLDPDFDGDAGDGNGKVTVANTSGSFSGGEVALQPSDGKIVVVGSGFQSTVESDNFAAIRLDDADGDLDTSFDTDGRTSFPVTPGAANDSATSVAVGTDIFMAGFTSGATSGNDFALARLSLTDGAPVSSFDTDGVVTTAMGAGTANDVANDVAIQTDGKLVLAGRSSSPSDDTALARYNAADGSLDASFDGSAGPGDGRIITPVFAGESDSLRALALTSTKIITAGSARTGDATGTDALIGHFLLSDGTRDFTVSPDPVPPDTTIVAGPGATTSDRIAIFGFVSNETGPTFQCSLDGAAFAECTSPFTTPTLSLGSHVFRVRARDQSNNLDPTPAERVFVVGATASGSPAPFPISAAADSQVDVRASARRRQRAGRRIAFFARCVVEACTVKASARISVPGGSARIFKTRRLTRKLAAGKRVKLSLRLSRKARLAARRALRRKRIVRATITVVATDESGNTDTARLRIRLRR